MKSIFNFLFLFLLVFIFPADSFAFSKKMISNTPVTGDFVMSPAKMNLEIIPGKESTGTLKILNRSGTTSEFYVEIEPNEEIPEEFRSYFIQYSEVDIYKFLLEHGEQAEISLKIKIPDNFSGKNIGGIVFISSRKLSDVSNSGTKIFARLGSLINIKIGESVSSVKEIVQEKDENWKSYGFGFIIVVLLFFIVKKWLRI